jgi:hypothetical protein
MMGLPQTMIVLGQRGEASGKGPKVIGGHYPEGDIRTSAPSSSSLCF